MRKVQDLTALFLILCVAVMTVVSMMGVWDVFGQEVITKSMQTIGLLSFSALVIMIAARVIDSKKVVSPDGINLTSAELISPAFSPIRHVAVVVLISAVTILALLGIMSIWEVLSGEVLSKSVSSMAIMAFSSLIIIGTCLYREKHPLLSQKISGGRIFLLLIGLWILFGIGMSIMGLVFRF